MKAIIINRQKGNILVMFTIGLFVLIAMSALALDSGHLLLNKSRLQNYVDAAALNAGKVIDVGGNHAQARAAALDIFNYNLTHNDAREIAATYTDTDMVVSFYHLPTDTTPADETDETAKFVKVVVSNLDLSNFLAGIFNFNKQVSASAIAGASTPIEYCFNDLVPMMVCGKDSSDDLFGFEAGEVHIMKIDAKQDSPIGPGNFQLVRLGDAKGADAIRTAMAGGNDAASQVCLGLGDDDIESDSEIETEPGNTVGPVAQGLNTRLGSYTGKMNNTSDIYPSDSNTIEGCRVLLSDEGIPYIEGKGNVDDTYMAVDEDLKPDPRVSSNPDFYSKIYQHKYYDPTDRTPYVPNTLECTEGDLSTEGVAGRRVMKVIVGDCTGDANGANTVDVMGVGCYFLTQTVGKKGNDSYVVGEFVENCTGNGWPSGNVNAKGPHTLVLYHVPDSTDS